ncbi:MAG: thioredoxin domain-containing protein [Rhizobium sp.]|nr:thioredoxin domain-containing protein [Rhizobium sp.]
MNRRLVVVCTALIAVALFSTGVWYYSGIKAREAANATADENTFVRAHSPVLGRADAPVTIVEFFDPSCEACRAFFPLVKSALEAYPEELRLVIRYTPFHEGSDEAVRILEAARKQDKFEPVLTALMEKQPEWATHGQPNLERAWGIAGEQGLDVERGRRDGAASDVDEVLRMDVADVEANNVKQTPTFFVNGKPLVEFSRQGFIDLVESEIKRLR